MMNIKIVQWEGRRRRRREAFGSDQKVQHSCYQYKYGARQVLCLRAFSSKISWIFWSVQGRDLVNVSRISASPSSIRFNDSEISPYVSLRLRMPPPPCPLPTSPFLSAAPEPTWPASAQLASLQFGPQSRWEARIVPVTVAGDSVEGRLPFFFQFLSVSSYGM